jgi:hypothetical protein
MTGDKAPLPNPSAHPAQSRLPMESITTSRRTCDLVTRWPEPVREALRLAGAPWSPERAPPPT